MSLGSKVPQYPQKEKPHILHPHETAGTTALLYISSSDFKEWFTGRRAEGQQILISWAAAPKF
jgi:hypothetical protein